MFLISPETAKKTSLFFTVVGMCLGMFRVFGSLVLLICSRGGGVAKEPVFFTTIPKVGKFPIVFLRRGPHIFTRNWELLSFALVLGRVGANSGSAFQVC